MEQNSFRLLDSPALLLATGPVPLRAERLFQLAVYLAASGEWQPRERLAALLWPECDSAAARRNLRKLLFRTSSQVREIEVRADAVRLRLASDVREFEAAHQQHDWARAVDLYRIPFADGLELNAPAPYHAWLQFERDRLAALFRSAVAQRLAQSADAEQCVLLARRWLALEALDEDALVALVEATVACGRPAEAQRLASDYAQRLAAELAVEPSARLRALAFAWQAAPAAIRPATTRDAGRTATDPGFIGRRTELLELKALLEREECRVLTITGPGGIGKSRLARVALAQLAPQFEAAAWIALEDLTDVAQVAPRAAAALGIALAGNTDPLTQVIQNARTRQMLLVADNAEHLSGFASLCAQLVQACPRLKLIQTSRARLAIDGEWLLPLAGLPVPDTDESEVAVLRSFDAVKLFESRALAAAPSFDCAGNAIDVAALVRSLEGAPLAIELAAAWVRLLPLAEIRRDIAESLDVFEASGHAPERQRSVRASFEHSWRLLTGGEQQGLVRLSIFAGAFTREAAAQVAGVKLPLLAALVDKSLLRADGGGRFSFHALMRQCAREKLADPEAICAAHTAYFVRLLSGPQNPPAAQQQVELDRIDHQLEDVRLAWRHAAETRDAEALQTMALPLMRFFVVRGRLAEGMELIAAALREIESPHDRRHGAPPRMTLAVLSHAHGTLQYRRGELAVAAATLQRAADLYRKLQMPALLRPCLVMLGMTAWTRGDPAGAQRHFEEVVRLAQAEGDELGCAQPLNGLALCARALGDYERALRLHEEALRLQARVGNPLGEAAMLHDLGALQYSLHRYADAQRTQQRALALCDAHALAAVRVFCLLSLGFVEIELGQLDSAQAHAERALQDDEAMGGSLVSTMVRLAFARIDTRRGNLAAAQPWLRQALERARAMGSTVTQLVALVYCAEWLAARGERMRAASLWSFVAGEARAEQGERDDARDALARMQLDPAEAEAAQRSAAGFELNGCIDSLLAEFAR